MALFEKPIKKQAKYSYMEEAGIMLDSRAVVENENLVCTGILTFAEGDIMEIEINEYSAYQLGEQVKITVYSLGGIYCISTTIIAKYPEAIVVLNPPDNQKRILNKREFPRVGFATEGKLYFVLDKADHMNACESVEIEIKNISMNGVGFVIEKTLYPDQFSSFILSFNLGVPLKCEIKVVRITEEDNGYYIGASITSLEEVKARALKSFIVTKQIKQRAQARKQPC